MAMQSFDTLEMAKRSFIANADELTAFAVVVIILLFFSMVFEKQSNGMLQKMIRASQVFLMLIGLACWYALHLVTTP